MDENEDKGSAISWKRVSAIIAAAVGAIGLMAAMAPVVKSDPPPWLGKKQADDLAARIEQSNNEAKAAILSRIVQMDIERLKRDYCAAISEDNRGLAEEMNRQIGAALTEYRKTAGSGYTLQPCR